MISYFKHKQISIQKIDFDLVGKMSIKLEDGRILIVPLKYFPDIKKMPVEKRKHYTILDDRTVLFRHSDHIYHVEDFIGLESKWRER